MSRHQIPLQDRVIFALDVPTPEQAKVLVEKHDSHIHFFKVGLQLFFAGGWPIVDFIVKRGNKVMLDLKLYDIPATVRLAVKQFADRGVSLTTVHGYKPVVEAALEADSGVNILAVTVLTSLGDDHLKELQFKGSIEELVLQRARNVIECGSHGIVCSAQEAAMLRSHLGDAFIMVTPGIRPVGSDVNDQQRIATPGGAISDGSDYLVIGRPIRDAGDPQKITHDIFQEIAGALPS